MFQTLIIIEFLSVFGNKYFLSQYFVSLVCYGRTGFQVIQKYPVSDSVVIFLARSLVKRYFRKFSFQREIQQEEDFHVKKNSLVFEHKSF